MRIPASFTAFLALTTICAASSGTAQQPTAAPPQYQVEIIVFANREFDPTEERFEQVLKNFDGGEIDTLAAPLVLDETTFPAPAAATPPGGLPSSTQPPLAAAAAETAVNAAEALRIRPLSPEQLELNNEYRKLSAIAAYQPLLHMGWIQPGLPENEAPTLDLSAAGVLNPSGTVRVHLARFLHITLDLTYQSPTAGATALSVSDGLDDLTLAPRYRLNTTRNARSGELHYFDHPAFGVLVRVRPLAAPGRGTAGRRPAA